MTQHADNDRKISFDVIDGTWEGGVVCLTCDRPLPPGSPFAENLDSLTEHGTPILDVVCVYCAMTPNG